ncbi:MAG: hypothetical protein IPN96_19535 [Anaerolineales bacterium]|nr:hypothetical protein [Anaerolineales bacterium]
MITRVRLADLTFNDTSTVLGETTTAIIHTTRWPGRLLTILFAGTSHQLRKPAQVFAVIDLNILDGIIIADQEDYTYNSPRWDPWGTALIFQQFKLHGAFKPEIGLWKSGFSEPLILQKASCRTGFHKNENKKISFYPLPHSLTGSSSKSSTSRRYLRPHAQRGTRPQPACRSNGI